jgi:hypothetical protein
VRLSQRRLWGVLIQRFATGIVLQTALAGQILLGVTPGFAADWRQDIGTFRIGMIAAGAPTGGGLEALRQSYSAALGMPVDFFHRPRFRHVDRCAGDIAH